MDQLGIKLHPYQEYAKDFIKSRPSCGLFLEMGLGKTLITLSALYEINPNCHVLVIAPKNIARATWMDEIKKWGFPFRTHSLIVNENGKSLTREKRLALYKSIPEKKPAIWFINRELITDLVKNTPVWHFPIVVIDELQSFKSHKSQRFKALKKVSNQIQHLIGLTGTPTPNGLMDLWAEIYLMDDGARLGHNITTYRDTFFHPGLHVNGFPVTWEEKDGAEEEIYRRISDIVISMKNTLLQLPPVTYRNIYAYMDDDETKLYKEFMKTQVLELMGEDDIVAVNAAVLQNKLSQMASGAIYLNNPDDQPNKIKEYKIIHDKKLEQCKYIIDNSRGPVLVAYHFRSDKEMLLDYFKDARAFDGSVEMIRSWNNKEIPIMLIQPASAGHGLNLQDGGHTLIWYTLTWSLESYLQTNARLYRQGQKEPVIIHHILTHNTVDDKILAALEKKDLSEQALLDAVRVSIESLND